VVGATGGQLQGEENDDVRWRSSRGERGGSLHCVGCVCVCVCVCVCMCVCGESAGNERRASKSVEERREEKSGEEGRRGEKRSAER